MTDHVQDSLVLMFDPFEGDFGSPGDKVLSDKMVVARKAHVCTHCSGPVATGERHRSRVEVVDGDMMAHRWCAACCDLMARIVGGRDPDDAEERYEARIGRHAKEASNG